eukprot:3140431-Pyramimonas_sp.AAC.1
MTTEVLRPALGEQQWRRSTHHVDAHLDEVASHPGRQPHARVGPLRVVIAEPEDGVRLVAHRGEVVLQPTSSLPLLAVDPEGVLPDDALGAAAVHAARALVDNEVRRLLHALLGLLRPLPPAPDVVQRRLDDVPRAHRRRLHRDLEGRVPRAPAGATHRRTGR